MAEGWDEFPAVEQQSAPPPQQAPSVWDEFPPAEKTASSEWDEFKRVEEPKPKPQAEGMIGSFAREFAHAAPGAVVGTGLGLYGAGAGAAVAGLPGAIVGGLGAGIVGGMAGEKISELGQRAAGFDDSAQRAANEEENKWSSAAGRAAAVVLGFGRGAVTNLAREAPTLAAKYGPELAARGGSAAIGGGFETGRQLVQEGTISSIPDIATQTAAGLIYNKPRAWAEPFERFGATLGGRSGAAAAAPPPPDPVGSGGNKDWTGWPANTPEAPPPAQGEFPWGAGKQQELPLEQPQETGRPWQPELPLEPPPTIDKEGQYGFPYQERNAQKDLPLEGGRGVYREPGYHGSSAPSTSAGVSETPIPPRKDADVGLQPDNKPVEAETKGYAKPLRPPTGETGGVHVGDTDPTLQHVFDFQKPPAPPPEPPTQYGAKLDAEFPQMPPGMAEAQGRPLEQNQRTGVPSGINQGILPEPPRPEGTTRLYSAEGGPRGLFFDSPEAAGRVGPVRYTDVKTSDLGQFRQGAQGELNTKNPVHERNARPLEPVPTEPVRAPKMEVSEAPPNVDAAVGRALAPEPPIPAAAAAGEAPPPPAAPVAEAPQGVTAAPPVTPPTEVPPAKVGPSTSEIPVAEPTRLEKTLARSRAAADRINAREAAREAPIHAAQRAEPTKLENGYTVKQTRGGDFVLDRPDGTAVSDKYFKTAQEAADFAAGQTPKNEKAVQQAQKRLDDEIGILDIMQQKRDAAVEAGIGAKGLSVHDRAIAKAEAKVAEAQAKLDELGGSQPLRREALERSAEGGRLSERTDALEAGIAKRAAEIEAGTAAPASFEGSQRLAIRRSDMKGKKGGEPPPPEAPATPIPPPEPPVPYRVVPDGQGGRNVMQGDTLVQNFKTLGEAYKAVETYRNVDAAEAARIAAGGKPKAKPAEAAPREVRAADKKDLEDGIWPTIQRFFMPGSRSESGQAGMAAYREGHGTTDQTKQQAMARFTNEMHRTDNAAYKMDPLERRKLENYAEGGQHLKTPGHELYDPNYKPSPEMQRVLDNTSKGYKDFATELQKLPQHEQMQFIQDFMPHMYENKAQAERFVNDWYGSSRGSLKTRTHPTMEDGIAAGLTPKNIGPIERFVRYSESIGGHISNMKTLNKLNADGWLHWTKPMAIGASGAPEPHVKFAPPEGYAPLKMPWATDKNGRQAYAPRDMAETLNNLYNAGLRRDGTTGNMYEFALQTKNMWTAAELGLSPYHAFTMVGETIGSNISRALSEAAGGRFKDAGATLAKAITSPYFDYGYGKRMIDVYKGTAKNVTPQEQTIIDALKKANIRPVGLAHVQDYEMASKLGSYADSYMKGSLKREMHEAAKEIFGGNYKKGAMFIPEQVARVMQTAMQPLFQHYIPAMKIAMASKDMASYLKANPLATADDLAKVARKTADSMDNRFGEMVKDNLSMNKAFKDAAFVSMRSFAFTIGGPIREVAGGLRSGVAGALKGENRLDMGSKAYDPRVAYSIAFPLVTMGMASVVQYAMTGTWPTDWKDTVTPKTGGKITTGKSEVEERVLLPGYHKDFLGWLFHPGRESFNKLAGPWQALYEQVSGKDWKDQKFIPPGATVGENLKARGEAVLNKMTPIALQSFQERNAPPTGTKLPLAVRAAGFRNPGSYIQDPDHDRKQLRFDEKEWQKREKQQNRDRMNRGLPPNEPRPRPLQP